MNKFIIGYGRYRRGKVVADVASVYAEDAEAAVQKARELCRESGLSAEEAGEPGLCWAEPFDIWAARDLGLAVWDDGYDGRAAPTPTSAKDGWMVAEARK